MVRFLDIVVKSVALLLGLALLASWGGPLHPAGDTLAVIRLPLATLCALAVIWTGWSRALRWGVAGLCLLILGQAVAQKAWTPAPGGLVIYQKNLWYGNRQGQALAADILARAPDVVTLQEISARNADVLAALAAAYPYRQVCRFSGWNGMAVLSRHPVVAGQGFCSGDRGLAGLQVVLPQGPVWVLSVHLHWPWPHGQRPQAQRLAGLIERLEGPVVLSGDFNMVPWGSDVRRLVRASGTMTAGPLQPTYWLDAGQRSGPGSGLWRLRLPLPLDQVHAPGGGAVDILPLLGADHAGVLARVKLHAD
jgi:endonuclease/exonuclease/phosphatase (EEP) superfamily protein YafD